MNDRQSPEGHPRRTTDDDTERTASERVVDALAASAGVTPIELAQPLNDSVDPDALDALFAPRHDGGPRTGDGYVEFSNNGYRVVVEKDGSVQVDSPVEPSA